jgi:periplasmic protein TonB
MFDSVLRPDFSQTRFGTGALVALAAHAIVAMLALTLSGQKPKAIVDLPRWPVAKIYRPTPVAQSGDSTQRPVESRRIRRRDLVLPPRNILPPETVETRSEANRMGDPQGQRIGSERGSPDGVEGAPPFDSYVPAVNPPRIELDESIVRLTKISGPDPEYTHRALERDVEGTMLVKCVITSYGLVEHCRVLKSLPFMDRAVIDALERRRYKPYVSNGNPVEIDYTFKIKLELPR